MPADVLLQARYLNEKKISSCGEKRKKVTRDQRERKMLVQCDVRISDYAGIEGASRITLVFRFIGSR